MLAHSLIEPGNEVVGCHIATRNMLVGADGTIMAGFKVRPAPSAHSERPSAATRWKPHFRSFTRFPRAARRSGRAGCHATSTPALVTTSASISGPT